MQGDIFLDVAFLKFIQFGMNLVLPLL